MFFWHFIYYKNDSPKYDIGIYADNYADGLAKAKTLCPSLGFNAIEATECGYPFKLGTNRVELKGVIDKAATNEQTCKLDFNADDYDSAIAKAKVFYRNRQLADIEFTLKENL